MTERRSGWATALLREPLVHFVLIGVLLFGADRLVPRRRGGGAQPAPTGAPSVTNGASIVVTEQVRRDLVNEFTHAYGRAPTDAEVSSLVNHWIDEEVLYREGLSRGFAESDPRVRQRIAEQMAFVLSSAVVVPEPTEAELRAWFAARISQWATPPLLDFTQVFVKGGDAAARDRAAGLLAELKSKDAPDPAGLGDVFSGGRRYRRRTIAELSDAFGPEFVRGLAEQPEGSWELRSSRFGLHLVRVDKRTPGGEPTFEAVRDRVRLDRDKSMRDTLGAAALQDLRRRFRIEGAP
ncbi:MAG: peptidyl-prolyl cis-trans isomerase [Deltaproteobacteria bacterium]|nr:peptidyl-prolyl cis-trans isomerase [Deltaproteobacteria bacterium]